MQITGLNSYDVIGKFQVHVRGDAANAQIIQRLVENAEANEYVYMYHSRVRW